MPAPAVPETLRYDPGLPLSGYRFAALPLEDIPPDVQGTPHGKTWEMFREARRVSKQYVHDLGAAVVEIATEEACQNLPIGDGRTFMLYAADPMVGWFRKREAAYFAGEGRDIFRPETRPLAERVDALDRLAENARRHGPRQGGLFPPFVLANAHIHRGHSKYLIETVEQLEQIVTFCRNPDNAESVLRLTTQEFIPTPGERYTSFRIDMSSLTGEPVSAALLYSGHSTAAPQHITGGDRLSEAMSTADRKIKIAFESEGFRARDVRSNASLRALPGGIIPLMGPGAQRRLTAEQRQILQAHGISPDAPALPPKLLKLAGRVSRAVGPWGDAGEGLDSLQHAGARDADGDPVYVLKEVNTGAGPSTWQACYPDGGAPGDAAARQHAFIALRKAYIDSLVCAVRARRS